MKQKLIFLTLFFTALFAFATEYFVDASMPDDNGAATNWATAKQTIQAAVGLTVDGDTVWVTNGLYDVNGATAPESSLTNRVCITNSIIVQSVNGPGVSTIDGKGMVRGVYMADGSSLSGFTVTNGCTLPVGDALSPVQNNGGGIYAETPNCLIVNCIIAGNSTADGNDGVLSVGGLSGNGGGVYGGTLQRCVLKGNRTGDGGAGGQSTNSAWIGGNAGHGGGVCNSELINCVLTDNSTGDGGIGGSSSMGHIIFWGGQGYSGSGGGAYESTVIQCTLYGNTVGSGATGGGFFTFPSIPTSGLVGTGSGVYGGAVQNSIVWGSLSNDVQNVTSVVYSCAGNLTNGIGNIHADPCFVDAVNGDLRVREVSPCVDAGDNSFVSDETDLNGNPRVVNGAVDMGAYELQTNCLQKIVYSIPADGSVFDVASTVYLSAAGGDSGNPVTFTNLPGSPVVWVNSTTLQFSARGDVYITASQAGDSHYYPAEPVTNHYFVTGPSVDFYVDASRADDSGNGTSWAAAKRTIQAAVDLTFDGDTVWVTNGVYDLGGRVASGWSLTNRVLINKVITVKSVNGPEYTIIQGDRTSGAEVRGVYMADGAALSGFTVTNGFTRASTNILPACDNNGGGIYAESTNCLIRNCIISGNATADGKVGVNGDPNGSVGMTAGFGGGAHGGTFINCIFSGNSTGNGGAGGNGYGMSGGSARGGDGGSGGNGGGACGSTLINCLFVNNLTGNGGAGGTAIALSGAIAGAQGNGGDGGGACNCSVAQCTFYGNLTGSGTEQGSGAGAYGGSLVNSIVWGDATNQISNVLSVSYTCAENVPGGDGNINEAPQFVDADAGLFEFKEGSPCIDAGNNAFASEGFDLAGRPRIINGTVDLGSLESLGVWVYGQEISDFTPAGGTIFEIADTVSLSAAGGNSGNSVTFTNLPGSPVVWINSTTIQFSAGGDVYITADQAGNSNYYSAATVTNHYFVRAPGTYYVDAARPDDTGGGTNWACAKRTIQAAANIAGSGSTIWVTNGVYNSGGMIAPGQTTSNRVCVMNAIALRSVNGRDVTTIEGAGPIGDAAVRCVYLSSGAMMTGFTLTNGYTRDGWDEMSGDFSGGGSLCETNATLEGCKIAHCEASTGGGVYKGVLKNCEVANNVAYRGGGCYRSVLFDSTVNNNDADDSGAGVFESTLYNSEVYGNTIDYTYDSSVGLGAGAMSSTLYSCKILNNNGTFGGGVYGGILHNCLVAGNQANERGGGAAESQLYNCTISGNWADLEGGGIYESAVYNSIVYNNGCSEGGSENFSGGIFRYSCTTPAVPGEGCLTSNPLWIEGQSLASNSPCVNAGNNSYVATTNDLSGNPRIISGTVDIGAYEFYATQDDYDSDGIPNGWAAEHFGGINRANANAVCSNGVNTVRQAYIAGLDPNDPDSRFDSELLPGNVLRWNAASGRVYAVYYSTNLISGFQPLETNIPWSARCFTDTVHNTDGQLFYKLDVRLEE